MKHSIFLAFMFFAFGSCTNLEEQLRQDLTTEQGAKFSDAASFLTAAYNGMRGPYQDQARLWAAQQHTSDETVGDRKSVV